MYRKIITSILVITIFMTSVITGYAKPTAPKIIISGDVLTFTQESGIPFVDNNGRTQVPVRQPLEKIGAIVGWDGDNQEVMVVYNDDENKFLLNIKITSNKIERINLNTAKKDIITTDTQPILKEGRTYLPIRPVFEALGYGVGWDQENYAVAINKKKDEPKPDSPFPIIFDGRQRDRMTSVKDQGNIGTCWAFAALGAVETRLAPEKRYSFSADHLSLNNGYDLTPEEGGFNMMAISYLAGWKGPVLESEDPYGDGATNKNAKPVVHLQEAQFLGDKDMTAVKKAIMDYGSVHTHVYSPRLDGKTESLYYNAEKKALYMLDDDYTRNMPANHDIILVGWDDSFSKDNFSIQPPGNGAFIAKNSWGTGFGDEGYYYISYFDKYVATENVTYSKVESNKNYDNIYQYDDFGYVNRLGYTESTAYFANVFTSKQNERLDAVSFYAVGPNTSYEVYAINKYDNDKTFSKRKLMSKGKFANAGYYTVVLDEPVISLKDEKFAVIVKITTPNEKYPIAVEMNSPENDYVSKAVSHPGESFISHRGTKWDDAVLKHQSNVCLKAFTTNYVVEEAAPTDQEGEPNNKANKEAGTTTPPATDDTTSPPVDGQGSNNDGNVETPPVDGGNSNNKEITQP